MEVEAIQSVRDINMEREAAQSNNVSLETIEAESAHNMDEECAETVEERKNTVKIQTYVVAVHVEHICAIYI